MASTPAWTPSWCLQPLPHRCSRQAGVCASLGGCSAMGECADNQGPADRSLWAGIRPRSVTGQHHPARLYLAPPALLHAPSLNPSPAYTAVYTLRGSVCSCRRTCQQPGPQQLLEGTRLAWPSLPALVPIITSVSARSLRHCMGTAAGCHNQVCMPPALAIPTAYTSSTGHFV